MFEKFKRKIKGMAPGQIEPEVAETSTDDAAEPILEPTPDALAVKPTEKTVQPTQEMAKAGELPSSDAVFFQDAEDQGEAPAEEKKSFFSRLATGLSKTRSGFSDGVAHLLLGKKEIDDDLLEELETQLVMADVGVEATQEIMAKLTERVGRKELTDSDALFEALIKELQDVLAPCEQPLMIDSANNKPYVILMVGINGVGKTTTIGKLAKQFQAKGKSVMLAAGDTFRAAAVEQLQVWGERNDVPVVAQHTGADSASVLYDALEAATARGTDILIADTAGRLHTKDNLMGELEKVVRVMKKIDPDAPHEVMLVLDAGTGQNAINQAVQFQKSVGVTGLTLTKLDGTAKGGVIFALAKQLALPVRFIGIGEGINDLRPFDANDFTRALFNKENL
ncbi:MAG: fused signal recognition particle receptor [Arenicella sp.]|jgi:fused signal recognition particle receptor